MMIGGVRFGSSLAFLILAAITGLVGFFIVYHYASFERPIQRFAVVIDAGSTQTRSSLYSISMQNPSADGLESKTPVSDVIQVRELAGCVNGGPLAAIGSPDDANRLLGKCLPKFARKIRRLDFLITMLDENPVNDDDPDDDELETEEVDRQMAMLNHRVNSVTHIHLGATAGMRALELLDPTRAEQKIHWMQSAIASSNTNPLLVGGVFMNPGFIDIIEGTSEASFGWLSVNFACDRLQIDTAHPAAGLAYDNDDQNQLDTTKYSLQLEQQMDVGSSKQQLAKLDSVGTLELGGASAQMAFQVAARGGGGGGATTKDESTSLAHNKSMQADSLELFGNNYRLATRSDLCLGMSQAILRTNYLLLRDHFQKHQSFYQPASSNQQQQATEPPMPIRAEIDNPCQQAGSQVNLSSSLVDSILNGACLDASARRKSSGDDAKFKQFISSVWHQQQTTTGGLLRIVGSGRVSQCDRLLSKLVDPEECEKLFSLCPESKNKQPPPNGMPFVTISGYNKALQVLNLTRASMTSASKQQGEDTDRQSSATEQVIEEKLGGYPIDYGEFEQKTRAFCSLDVREFPVRFPKMNKVFYDVNCLQMVYIRRLLTEFYQFRPGAGGSWGQLRFLLFPIGLPAKSGGSAAPLAAARSKKNDIGWTLGLLLNATSYELSADSSQSHDIIYHHGASIQFIIRTTVFLMFACVFIAGGIIVFSMVLARRKHRAAYICHSAAHTDPERAAPPAQPANGLQQ